MGAINFFAGRLRHQDRLGRINDRSAKALSRYRPGGTRPDLTKARQLAELVLIPLAKEYNKLAERGNREASLKAWAIEVDIEAVLGEQTQPPAVEPVKTEPVQEKTYPRIALEDLGRVYEVEGVKHVDVLWSDKVYALFEETGIFDLSRSQMTHSGDFCSGRGGESIEIKTIREGQKMRDGEPVYVDGVMVDFVVQILNKCVSPIVLEEVQSDNYRDEALRLRIKQS